MDKSKLLTVVSALAFGAGMALSTGAAASDDLDAFGQAKAIGTVEAYQSFLSAHPTSKLAAHAVAAIGAKAAPAPNVAAPAPNVAAPAAAPASAPSAGKSGQGKGSSGSASAGNSGTTGSEAGADSQY